MRTTITAKFVRLGGALMLALVATFGLAACSDDTTGDDVPGVENLPEPGPEEETATEEPGPAYEGAYDAAFVEKLDEHDGESVALTAEVGEVVSENAFTITGADTEPLLVVSSNPVADLAPGTSVTVTGELNKAFNLPEVEDRISIDFEDDNVFQGFDRDPYVEATAVEMATEDTGTATP